MPKYKDKFDFLYSEGTKTKYYDRIDNLLYTYSFVTFTFRDYNLKPNLFWPGRQNTDTLPVTTTEIYFKGNDTLPFQIFKDGIMLDTSDYHYKEYYYLSELKSTFEKLQTQQELPYEKVQNYHFGCIVPHNANSKKNRRKRQNQLRNTYQIQEYITPDKIKVSFQTPPKRPKIKIVIHGGF